MLVVFKDTNGDELAVESTMVKELGTSVVNGETWIYTSDGRQIRVVGRVSEVAAALNGEVPNG